MSNITRRSILTGIATSAIAATLEHNAQAKPVHLTPKQVAIALLSMANKVEHSRMTAETRTKLTEILESMSHDVQVKYNIESLCDTDTACDKLVVGTR